MYNEPIDKNFLPHLTNKRKKPFFSAFRRAIPSPPYLHQTHRSMASRVGPGTGDAEEVSHRRREKPFVRPLPLITFTRGPCSPARIGRLCRYLRSWSWLSCRAWPSFCQSPVPPTLSLLKR